MGEQQGRIGNAAESYGILRVTCHAGASAGSAFFPKWRAGRLNLPLVGPSLSSRSRTVVKMAAGAGFRVLCGGYLVVVRLGGRMAAWCGGVLWGFWLVSVRGAIPQSHCCQIRPLSLPFLGLSVCRAVSRLHCRRMRLDSGTVRGDILPSCDRPVARQPDTAVRVVNPNGTVCYVTPRSHVRLVVRGLLIRSPACEPVGDETVEADMLRRRRDAEFAVQFRRNSKQDFPGIAAFREWNRGWNAGCMHGGDAAHGFRFDGGQRFDLGGRCRGAFRQFRHGGLVLLAFRVPPDLIGVMMRVDGGRCLLLAGISHVAPRRASSVGICITYGMPPPGAVSSRLALMLSSRAPPCSLLCGRRIVIRTLRPASLIQHPRTPRLRIASQLPALNIVPVAQPVIADTPLSAPRAVAWRAIGKTR